MLATSSFPAPTSQRFHTWNVTAVRTAVTTPTRSESGESLKPNRHRGCDGVREQCSELTRGAGNQIRRIEKYAAGGNSEISVIAQFHRRLSHRGDECVEEGLVLGPVAQ